MRFVFDVTLDLGFHVVIGVGRLTVQKEGFRRQFHLHHAYAIPSTKFFSSGCCSPTLSCHRQLNLYPKFLHISQRENWSFEVLSLHNSKPFTFPCSLKVCFAFELRGVYSLLQLSFNSSTDVSLSGWFRMDRTKLEIQFFRISLTVLPCRRTTRGAFGGSGGLL